MSDPATGGQGAGAVATAATATVSDWRASLAPEYQSHPSLSDIKDLNSLAKTYIHAQTLVGADKLVLPKGDDDVEGWNQAFDRLGRPKDHKEYGFTKPENLPDFIPWDEAKTEKFSAKMHELGLTKKQAGALFEYYNKDFIETAQSHVQQITQSREQVTQELKKEWGAAFEQNVGISVRAINSLPPELGTELKNVLNQTGLGDHPVVIKAFHALGAKLLEDVSIGTNNGSNINSPDKAKAEIASLKANPEFIKAWTSKADPGHVEAVRRLNRLHQEAYPQQD